MLVFTNEQIKNITKDIILIPSVINDPSTGLIAQKQLILGAKDSLLKTDEDQKVFSDFWIDTIVKYHAELLLLNSEQRTNYSSSFIDEAGNSTGVHFPSSPIWTKFVPKVDASNNGNPRIITTNKNELDLINDILDIFPLFKNGFSGGGFSEFVVVSGNSITIEETATLSVGQLLLVNTSTSFIVKILSITPNQAASSGPPPVPAVDGSITFEVILGVASDGMGNATDSFPGFSNSQRAGSSSTSPYTGIFGTFKQEISDKVTAWENNLISQKNEVEFNGDLPPRKPSNTLAKDNLLSTITIIDQWQVLPEVSSSGKFTDAGLLLLENLKVTREAQRLARISQIENNLGSVSQDSDGNYSGTGAYYDLFKQIDLRTAKGSGTLSQYYQINGGIGLFDKKIESANNQLTQYTNTFALTRIVGQSIVGQNSFEVQDVADFAIGDTVFVLDNDTIVFTRTISNISGNIIILNNGIPTVLSESSMARIAKQR